MHIPDKTQTLDRTMNIHTRWPATFLKKGVDTKIKYTGDETDPET